LLENVEVSWTTPRGGDVAAILEDENIRITEASAVEHYPDRRDQELNSLVAGFLRPTVPRPVVSDCLVFGNGASELIDLSARAGPPGPYCLSPFSVVQYREYERVCKNAGREKVSSPKDAAIVCVVNPNNPTGDFLERPALESWIEENVSPGAWVVVDESMLFWGGPAWHERGISHDFIVRMNARNIRILLIYSWTKIFACTGMRVGSVLCPTVEVRRAIEGLQVPWSLNIFAKTYLKEALRDKEYLESTWRVTKQWRKHIVTRLNRLFPTWKIYGEEWLSWVWADTGDEATAKAVYEASKECGCPIRHAAAGYGLPTFVRFAVRRPSDFAVLYQALLQHECTAHDSVQKKAPFGTYADVRPGTMEGVFLVHINDLKAHEAIGKESAEKLKSYIDDLPVKNLPAIIVDSQHQVVIDGHHRLELFRQAGMLIVPAVFVRYEHPDILVNPPAANKDVTKEQVIMAALRGEVMPPKSTQHMVRSRGGTLLPIIVLAPQIAEIQMQ